MICTRCRHSLLSSLSQSSRSLRQTSISPPRFYATANAGSPPAPRQPSTTGSAPSATSSATPGISQPLSTPEFPSSNPDPTAATPAKPLREPSSCVAGTRLLGLGFLKNKPEVLAQEDEKYPDWLWGVLDSGKKEDESWKIDTTGMNKKARARADKKMAIAKAALPKKIPLHEQSIDLTGPDATGVESVQKRQELTSSARQARRKGIREDNFLRGL